MSKSIKIQEGGIAKNLTVDKLKTNLVGGGTCLWVPEDGISLGNKYITQNGTYIANDDGYYGYSEVTVNGVGSVIGKDPDDSGDDATATVDPITGKITVEKIPSSIRVIEPPTNQYGTYKNNQAISKNGMVVKAYFQSGGEYGTVPNGEITINPTVAVYDEATDIPSGGTASSDLNTGINQPISYTGTAYTYEKFQLPGSQTEDTLITRQVVGGRIAGIWINEENHTGAFVLADSKPFVITTTYYNYTPVKNVDGTYSWSSSSSSTSYNASENPYTYDDKPVYYGAVLFAAPEATVNNNGEYSPSNEGAIAWTMVYGTGESHSAGSRQQINVSWPRPGDGKVLTTSFEILVAPPLYGGSDN